MADDNDLFGNPIPPRRNRAGAYARSSDPDTSHEAAHRTSFEVQRLEALVFRTLKEHGTWMSVLMIEEATGENRWSISPRMLPLEEAGLIERKKMPGKNSTGKIRNLIHSRIRKQT